MKWRDRKGFSTARVDCFQHFSLVIAGIQIAVVRAGLLLVSGQWGKSWLDQRVSSLSSRMRSMTLVCCVFMVSLCKGFFCEGVKGLLASFI